MRGGGVDCEGGTGEGSKSLYTFQWRMENKSPRSGISGPSAEEAGRIQDVHISSITVPFAWVGANLNGYHDDNPWRQIWVAIRDCEDRGIDRDGHFVMAVCHMTLAYVAFINGQTI